MSFLFSTKKEKISLHIHIDSASVSGGFVLFSEGKNPKILRNIRLSLGIDHKNKTSTPLVQMIKSLDSVLAELLSEKVRIDTVHVVISEPWCISGLKKIHISQDKKFIITESFLTEIISKEADQIKTELAGVDTEDPSQPVEIIEKNIFNTEVNGYLVENCIGLQTKVFDLSLHVSVVPTHLLDALVQTIFSHTHINAGGITVRSFSFISFFVLKSLPLPEVKEISPGNFLIMDVSGERTNISLIQNNALVQTVSFPLGSHHIIRHMSKALDVSPEIAESTLRIVLSGKMDAELTEKVQKVIEGIEKEWQIYFEDALLSLDSRLAIPAKIFLLSPDYLTELQTQFMTIQKTDATANFRRKVKVVPVNHEFLKTLCDASIRDTFDPHMIISALFHKK